MKTRIAVLFALSAVTLAACSSHPLEAPPPPAYVSPVPDNWPQAQAKKSQKKSDYLQSHQVAYDWFGNFAFSETDGIPYLVLKLLPKLAPELWGSEENFLDAVGLFIDERQKAYPVARGIGFSGLSRSDAQGDIDYASFTCGACHIGRVRLENGQIDYLDGGVNGSFNIVQYRVKAYQTLQKAYAGKTGDERFAVLTQKLLDALDATHQQNPNYFYNNFQSAVRKFDAAYEAAQIALFKKNAGQTVKQFAQRTEAEYEGFGALAAKNYAGFESQMLTGFPGMADATGLSAINGYIGLRSKPILKWFAGIVLPPEPGITDFMSVWEQDKRRASWDESHKRLINGGGQWNGNVPMPIYRNLIAMLTLGLENTDVRVAAFAEELLDGLPASPYPFNVDIALAKQGQALFAEHCADCHQPKNGKVYDNLGTSMKRAYVVGAVLNYAARNAVGIDMEAGYKMSVGDGSLTTRVVYTHMLERNNYLDPTDPKRANRVLSELGDPEDAFNVNFDYSIGKLSLGYELRYIGKQVLNAAEDVFSVQGRPPENADWADRKYYPSVVYHDLRAGFDPTDPKRPGQKCAAPGDADGDGLRDCEEAVYGTDPRLFDTDGDRMSDLSEVRAGLDPLDANDAFADPDRDGAFSIDELRFHTDPLASDQARRPSDGRYAYDVVERASAFGDRSCYDLTVRNIRLVTSDAAGVKGKNRILLYFDEALRDRPQDYGLLRVACVDARYVDGLVKSPPSGSVKLEEKNFMPAARFKPDVDCLDYTSWDPSLAGDAGIDDGGSSDGSAAVRDLR